MLYKLPSLILVVFVITFANAQNTGTQQPGVQQPPYNTEPQQPGIQQPPLNTGTQQPGIQQPPLTTGTQQPGIQQPPHQTGPQQPGTQQPPHQTGPQQPNAQQPHHQTGPQQPNAQQPHHQTGPQQPNTQQPHQNADSQHSKKAASTDKDTKKDSTEKDDKASTEDVEKKIVVTANDLQKVLERFTPEDKKVIKRIQDQIITWSEDIFTEIRAYREFVIDARKKAEKQYNTLSPEAKQAITIEKDLKSKLSPGALKVLNGVELQTQH